MNDDSPTEVQKDQMLRIARVLDELDNTSDKIGTLVTAISRPPMCSCTALAR